MWAVAIYHQTCALIPAALAKFCLEKRVLSGYVHSCAKIYRDNLDYAAFCGILLRQVDASHVPKCEGIIKTLVEIECGLLDDLVQICGGYLTVCGVAVDPALVKGFIKWSCNALFKDLGGRGLIFNLDLDKQEWAEKTHGVLIEEARKDEAEVQVAVDKRSMAKVSGNSVAGAQERMFDLSADF